MEYEKHNFYRLATKMLAEKENSVSYNAYQSYECSLKHLSPFFKMAIEEITPSIFQRIIDDMALKKYAYAKLLYCAGIDPKTMQRLLGDAKFETTMNIYTDFANEMTEQSVGKLNEYMGERF